MAEYKRQGSIDDENFLYLAEKGSEDNKVLSDNLNTCLVNLQSGIVNSANEIKESLDDIKEALGDTSNTKYIFMIMSKEDSEYIIDSGSKVCDDQVFCLNLENILAHCSNFIISRNICELFDNPDFVLFNPLIVNTPSDFVNCIYLRYEFYNPTDAVRQYVIPKDTQLFSFVCDIDIVDVIDETGFPYIEIIV